jgi:hypothetical protein
MISLTKLFILQDIERLIVETPDAAGVRIVVVILKVIYARATWSNDPMSLEEIREVRPQQHTCCSVRSLH